MIEAIFDGLSVLAVLVIFFFAGHVFGSMHLHERIMRVVDRNETLPTRTGLVHVVSLQRYRELLSRESHYFRYKRRHEQQNEHLDD